MNKNNLRMMFLEETFKDSLKDFNKSCKIDDFPKWDAIIITASNVQQAKGYSLQLEARKKKGQLPKNTKFLVVPDKDDKRIGSAGSTLMVIQELKKEYESFEGKKFLCIHAGGDSKRCPQYSALGKLFSPIPTSINNHQASLFDMFLVSMASIPSRMKEGMWLLSGDVILLFNGLMCDFGNSDASVISFKENVKTAIHHGVYLHGEDGNVKKFLHKQSEKTLREIGAVDENDNCNIDTGAILLGTTILNKLSDLVESHEEELIDEKVRLSLYGDIAYCLAEDSTLEDFYLEKPEGDDTPELKKARELLWNAIGNYSMKLINLAPAKFVHFGRIPEILNLMESGVKDYEPLGWKKHIASSIYNDENAAYNSILSKEAKIGKGNYLECSYVHGKASLGCRSYISYLDVEEETIPDDVLLHGLKLNSGKYVCRMMGTYDNPKENKLFGKDILEIIKKNNIDECLIWNSEDHSLWNANLYKECDSMKEALASSLKIYDFFVKEKGSSKDLLEGKRTSLCASFNDANPSSILDWSSHLEDLVKMDELDKLIKEKKSVELGKPLFNKKELTENQKKWVEKAISKLDFQNLEDFGYGIRLYYYLGTLLEKNDYIEKCFGLIANTILDSTLSSLKYNDTYQIQKEEVIVKLPLRVNFGGGWSDTPPHCLEQGGKVLNCAISLNGELPVEVSIQKIKEYKIVFDSRDMDVHGEFDTIEPLQDTGNPFDSFALQKACLLACGILPKQGGNLNEILTRMGGGFEMHSEVRNVPKGSGLGTSSILSAACVKAMLEFVGAKVSEEELYATVSSMEQIMSTGGGWQDQVGGVTNGFKYITSEKGINQEIKVEHLNLSEKVKKELDERFCILYTGQRRLARNLLREVVGRYLGSIEESIAAHQKIQEVATQMKEALLKEDVDAFARLLNYHWDLSRMIDEGSSNTLIDQIFAVIDDLIDAKMVCGAGGGGFLQVILSKGVSKKQVHDRLKEVFLDFPVDIWDSKIEY